LKCGNNPDITPTRIAKKNTPDCHILETESINPKSNKEGVFILLPNNFPSNTTLAPICTCAIMNVIMFTIKKININ